MTVRIATLLEEYMSSLPENVFKVIDPEVAFDNLMTKVNAILADRDISLSEPEITAIEEAIQTAINDNVQLPPITYTNALMNIDGLLEYLTSLLSVVDNQTTTNTADIEQIPNIVEGDGIDISTVDNTATVSITDRSHSTLMGRKTASGDGPPEDLSVIEARDLLGVSTTPIFKDIVADFGADPTGVADSTAAFQAAVDYPSSNQYGLIGTRVAIPEGQYRITDTIECYRWSGSFEGAGCGNSPTYSVGSPVSNGAGSVLIWDGAAGIPMFHILDSYRPTFKNFRIEGKDSAKPSAIWHYESRSEDTQGTNAYLTIDGMHAGVYAWTTRGTHYGEVESIIKIDGDNVNTDEFRITNSTFKNKSRTGIGIDCSGHTQGVWSSVKDCTIDSFDVGIKTASTLSMYNVAFNACGTDVQLTGTNTLFIKDWQSENSNQFAILNTQSKLVVDGGRLQCTYLDNAEGSIVKANPTDSEQKIHFTDVEFWGTIPASATVAFGPTSPLYSAYKGFSIRFLRCRGLKTSHLAVATGASLSWASNTVGVIEWDCWEDTVGHQMFRNEFRGSVGLGSYPVRTTLDNTAYDMPGTVGTQISGLAAAINGPAYSGSYLHFPQPALGTPNVGTADKLYLIPIMVDRACTLNQLSVYVTTGGTTGDLARLGIYRDTEGKPSTLLLDAGTVATETSTAWANIAISQAVTPGVYWLAMARQGGAGTRCTTAYYTNVASPLMRKEARYQTLAYMGWSQTSVSGALPSSLTPAMEYQHIPILTAKVA